MGPFSDKIAALNRTQVLVTQTINAGIRYHPQNEDGITIDRGSLCLNVAIANDRPIADNRAVAGNDTVTYDRTVADDRAIANDSAQSKEKRTIADGNASAKQNLVADNRAVTGENAVADNRAVNDNHAVTDDSALTDKDGCSDATLKGDYAFAVTGWTLSPGPLWVPNFVVGIGRFDGKGNFTQVDYPADGLRTSNGNLTDFRMGETGSYAVNPDCTGSQEINLNAPGVPPALQAG